MILCDESISHSMEKFCINEKTISSRHRGKTGITIGSNVLLLKHLSAKAKIKSVDKTMWYELICFRFQEQGRNAI